jgi:hypothetical protein
MSLSVIAVLGSLLAAMPVPDDAIRLPVTRDTWFSNVGHEADANLGGAPRLKLKSIQEMSLIDVDTAPLKGKIVRSATLHLKSSGPPALQRVTVGSFGADWTEGTSTTYAPQVGASTHKHRRHPDVPWTIPGSDLCSVILGQGGTTWRMADASPPDADGWQAIPVDPTIVAARVAGISQGFFLFDDTGTTWTRDGDRFTCQHFPNRFVMSRDSNRASAPYLTVSLGETDDTPPSAPSDVRSDVADLPAGEAWVSWTTPTDVGPAGTIGFFVAMDGRELPRYLIPLPPVKGGRVKMHFRDIGRPGSLATLSIRAVDGAGNIGKAAETRIRLSDHLPASLPGVTPIVTTKQAPLPKLGRGEVAILDELDKVQPITGEMIPPEPEGYLAANHLWDAGNRRIRLHAARNEFVGFQILLRGPIAGATPRLTFSGPDGSKIRAEFGRYRHVATTKGPLPDPIERLERRRDEVIPGQTSASLHAEVYVPHEVSAGDHQGVLIVESGGESLTIAVSLRVWDLTLPDSLSFLPEMNCYGLPENERDYYRLAHLHRTVLNRLPYSQTGKIHDGCAPAWDGKRLDWTAWDRRFGPYLDGSAFADLPRKGVPIECFYLPIHENWPTSMEGNYNGDSWADRAFTPAYRRDFVEVARQMAEHANAKRWNGTLFHAFLNNKVDFKAKGWSRGSSPWLLDEPANFQDFWALHYFGEAFHEGFRKSPGPARLVFRADISRPEWQRDSLDGLLDYNVVGGAMRKYRRIVLDRKAAEGQIVVEYGSSNAIEQANVQPVGWSLDVWSLGADGVLPWQTVGRGESWQDADTLSLFYPGRDSREPVPSIRLKAYRRGQQDVEYLTLLAATTGEPRWSIGDRVRETLGLSAERKGSGFAGGEDAGVIHYERLRPRDDWALRVRLGEVLSARHLAPSRRLVEFKTPPRDPSGIGAGGPVFVRER